MQINKQPDKQFPMRSICSQSVAQWLVLGALLLAFSQALSAANPLSWLEKMQKAVHLLDYEGRFVYQAGAHLESMYVVHRVHGQRELERLVALDGEPREVIRGDDAVAFIKPGEHPISVKETPNQYALSLNRKWDYTRLEAYYQIQFVGENRVAGRPCQVIEIIPKDELRYGHRLYLDQSTALPLRSVLLDTRGELLSQNLFVELRVGEGITPIERDFSALSVIQAKSEKATASGQSPQMKWTFADLPDGYRQTAYRYQAQQQREHFIFSDGLSSVSLYIEQAQAGKKMLSGHSSMGATHTLALEKHGRQIMLIGEAPIRALHKLAEALQQND